jgi:atypical dual specificity phosphatase
MPSESFEQLRLRARNDRAFLHKLVESPLTILRDYDLTEDERRMVVLPNFGWLIEGRLAGLGRPRSDDAFAMLRAFGVRALVSLTEDPLPAAALTRHGLAAVHLPVRDSTPPSVVQIEQAIAAITGWLARDTPVGVHCAAGVGRTGTVLACYLVSQGEAPESAIASVRARRPGSIETAGQEGAIAAYARRLR